MEGNQEGGRASKVIARGMLGAVYGLRIGILAGALVMLLAWAWSPKALLLGAAIFISTIFAGLISGLAMGTGQGGKAVARRGGSALAFHGTADSAVEAPQQARTLPIVNRRGATSVLRTEWAPGQRSAVQGEHGSERTGSCASELGLGGSGA